MGGPTCQPDDVIDLPPIIDRISALLADDTDASATYAALEARLALEKVVYDRLRQRHDYISHAQLKRWQPGAIINTLLAEVDDSITQTVSVGVGLSDADSGIAPQDDEYAHVGTEVGFDPKLLVSMWNALAKLALHVRLPEHSKDDIPDFGDKEKIKSKVQEVVFELERLAKGTMTISGVGEIVWFVCVCGEKNKRRSALLKEGQSVACFNPNCEHAYIVKKGDDGFTFETDLLSINCDECQVEINFPRRTLMKMKYDHRGSCRCPKCGHVNYFQWRIFQLRRTDDERKTGES